MHIFSTWNMITLLREWVASKFNKINWTNLWFFGLVLIDLKWKFILRWHFGDFFTLEFRSAVYNFDQRSLKFWIDCSPNFIRAREAGLPSLPWNRVAKQQGTPSSTRSQAAAGQDVQRKDIAKLLDSTDFASWFPERYLDKCSCWPLLNLARREWATSPSGFNTKITNSEPGHACELVFRVVR
jgi:hypothetical protein